MQITYQKNDGCIIQKIRKTMLPYKIGDTTSMGWKVLNIEYEYNNKYYSENEYYSIMHKIKNNKIKKKKNKELYISEFKKFMYYFVAVLIVKFITIILGI